MRIGNVSRRALLFFSLAFLNASVLPPFLHAQVPPQMNFQAKLLDKSNNPINATVSIVFSIYNVPTGGTPLWTETQPSVTVSNGVYDVQIGSVVPLSTAVFSGGVTYLGIKISPDTSEMTPREKLVSSPYSLVSSALSSNGEIPIQAGGGVNVSTFSTDGNLIMAYGISATTGTFTGTLTMSGGSADIVSASSITAGEFFGNGAGLTNVPSGSPSGTAGGSLSGTYPNPSLNTTQSQAITWSGAQTLSGGANFPGSGIWNTSGNVGIGTTTTSQELTVINSLSITNTAGQQYLLMGNQNSAGVNDPAAIQGANGSLSFGHGNSWSGSGGTFTGNLYLANSGGLALGSYAGSFADAGAGNMIISGNVGIGTTGPTNPLSVSGNANVAGTLTVASETSTGTLTMSGANADIISASSITAGEFFGNGAGLTNVPSGSPSGAAGGDLTGSYPNPDIGTLPAISGAALTNLTGANVSGNIPGNAANVTGTVAIANGGTGATTAAAAQTALGIQTIANGGTNASTIAGAQTNLEIVPTTGGTMTGALTMSGGSADIVSASSITAGEFFGNGAGLTNVPSGSPSGSAGGDLTGTYPNPTIATLPAISGAALTSLTGANVSGNIPGNATNVTGTVAIANGGTGANTVTGAQSNLNIVQSTGGVMTGALTMSGGSADIISASSITAGEFYGNGAGLTNVPNGSPSGTAGGSLSGTYPNPSLNTTQSQVITWSGAQTLSGGANFPGSGIWNTSGNVGIGTTTPTESLSVSGNALFGTNSWLQLQDTGAGNGRFIISGTGSSDFGGSYLWRNMAGTVIYMQLLNNGNLSIGTGVDISTFSAGDLNVPGTVIAGTFSGSGASLTNLPWSSLTGYPTACAANEYVSAVGGTLTCSIPSGTGLSSVTSNASLIGNGTGGSPLGVSPSSGTLQGNTFNGASELVQLNSSGDYPALNGSNITNLTGANVSGNIPGDAANVTGTVAIANGGTGQTSAAAAQTALGIQTIANGGTNASTIAGAQTNLDIVPTTGGTMTGTLTMSGANADVVSASSITAGEFFGNGAGLTNLPSGSPSGTAGGSLSGTYPNPSLNTTQSQVITWSGAQTLNGGANFPGSGIWNTSGNVGIGTTSPTEAKLQFANSLGNDIVMWTDTPNMDYGLGMAPSTLAAFVPVGYHFAVAQDSATGTQVATIDSSGNAYFAGSVGIGTTSPTNPLTVSGNANVNGSLAVASETSTGTLTMSGGSADIVSASSITAGEFFGNGAGLTNLPSGSPSGTAGGSLSGTYPNPSLNTTQSQAITWSGAQTLSGGANFPGSGIWNTSGNVGIGTASPVHALDVTGGIMATSSVTANTFINSGSLPGANYLSSDFLWFQSAVAASSLPSGAQGLYYSSSGSPGGATFTGPLTATGFYGSGAGLTSLPWSSLTGYPAACATGEYVSAVGGSLTCGTPAGTGVTGSGTTNYIARWTGASSLGTGALYDNGTDVGVGNSSPAGLFEVGTGTFTVLSSGNIGIGTTSPGGLLELNGLGGGGGNYQVIIASGTGGAGSGINLNATQSRSYTILATGPSSGAGAGDLGFFDETASAYRAVINSNGNFGIGTTSPGTALDVNGTATATTFAGSGASLTNLPWGSLTGYPAACAAGEYVSAVGGSLTCSTPAGTGVTSVTATAPLASSGGTTPDISLTGTVAIANGGTGATTAAGAQTSLGVPSDTGSGASGTWPISITGTSAGAPPTGTAGGDLTGTYPNPTLNLGNAHTWTAMQGFSGGIGPITGSPSGSQGAYMGWNTLGGGGTGETDFINNEGGGPGGFAFINANSAGVHLSTPVFIAGGGDVGIDTTPGSTLDVLGPSGSDTNIENSGTNTFQFETGKATGAQILYGGNDSTNHLSYIQAVNWGTGTDTLLLDARGGNVGILTTSPVLGSNYLTIGGNTYFGTSGSYDVTSAGAATLATSYFGGLMPAGGDNTGNIGTSTDRWTTVHAVNFYGVYNTGPDLAERYPAAEPLEPGDVVIFDKNPSLKTTVFDQSKTKDGNTVVSGKKIPVSVRKSTFAYESGIVGVVSTAPGVKLHDPDDNKNPPIALIGRVPIKVNLEGGAIHIGDYLTSSSKPGYAMKATEAGPTLGIALENFDGSKGESGKILGFVHVGDGNEARTIKNLKRTVDQLKALICGDHPHAPACQ